jgi:sec-independent protein translocase protein TatA
VLLIFDISGGELILILVVVLLFFGAKGIPDVARTMGRISRQLRDASAEVQREIQKGANDVKRGYEEQRKSFALDQPDEPARPIVPPQPPADQVTPEATPAEPKV